MSAVSFVVYSLLCSAVITLLAICVHAICDERRAPRRWVWMVAIGASVLVPLSALLQKPTSVRPEVDQLQTTQVVESPNPATFISRGAPQVALLSAESLLARLAPLEPAVRLVVWSSLLVVPLLILIEWSRLRRARRAWREDSMCNVPLSISEDFGPAVVGVIEPRIVVPSFVRSLPEQHQRMVIAHEVQHVRAHDSRWAFALLLMLGLTPWNLLVWWQFSRLRLAIEIDCDARVLQDDADSHAYGSLLLEMAARARRMSPIAVAFLARHKSSLRQRIENFSSPLPRTNRARMAVATALGATVAPAMFMLPRPTISAHVRTAAEFVADSGAIAVMELNRSGRWAEAEGMGVGFLAARPTTTGSGESCAVLIGVTYAQALQRKNADATASMARFDRECAKAEYGGFIPAESDRVRRIVNGESPNSVYGLAAKSNSAAAAGATGVMMRNREGRHTEAEQMGLSFLSRPENHLGEPEPCAVLIGVTYAQALQRRTADAKRSLSQFDRECTGVRYSDWFPAEADRVRRMVNGEPPSAVYDPVPRPLLQSSFE